MKRLFVDLSLTVQTGAGSAVYAWEICHRLMRLGLPLQVLPMTCPFRTMDRTGPARKVQALLRDVLWRPFLAGLEAGSRDCFLFTNAFVPRRFWGREYGVIMLDLGAWRDRNILNWRGRLSTAALPRVLTGARHVFAISEFTAQDLCKQFKIPRERIMLTPCGLSETFLKPELPAKPRTLNGIPVPDRYLLHVGSLEPKKNIAFLLDVYRTLRSTGHPLASQCKLLLTGAEAWRNPNLKSILAAHPHARDIAVLGRVNPVDMTALYEHASALVFPSTLEGFGLPVIEALSRGTPVLIQRNSSLEQFGPFGAAVFDTFDASQWAGQLLDIIIHSRRLPDDQVMAVRHAFNWDRSARTILETMLDLPPAPNPVPPCASD